MQKFSFRFTFSGVSGYEMSKRFFRQKIKKPKHVKTMRVKYLHKIQDCHRLQHIFIMFHQRLVCQSGPRHHVVQKSFQHALTHLPVHLTINQAPRPADETGFTGSK